MAAILLEIAAKSSIVLLLAAGATRLMRRAAAATRHVVWALALAATLLMPVLVVFGPSWEFSGISTKWTSRVAAVATSWTRSGGPRRDGEIWRPSASDSHAPFSPEWGQAQSADDSRGFMARSSAAVLQVGWPMVFIAAWVIGTVFGLISVLIGLASAALVTRRAIAIRDPEWTATQAETLDAHNIGRSVRLLCSESISVPVACGILRPALVVPADAISWDGERRRIVLLHELAHVKRHDCLTQLVAHVALALQWCNPLAWMAVSRLRAEQERACDDLVLVMGTQATTYADHLCEIASQAKRTFAPGWATLAIARPSRLETRVTAILDRGCSRRTLTWKLAFATAMTAALCIVPIGALKPVAVAEAIAILPSAALNALPPDALVLPTAGVASGGIAAIEAEPTPALLAYKPGASALNAETGRSFLAACTSCHSGSLKAAGLALDAVNFERIGDDPELWEKVVGKLRGGLHPPAAPGRPGRADIDAFSASIEGALDLTDQAVRTSSAGERIDGQGLAERLAKLLWSAEPDAALLKAASSGQLREPGGIRQQVRRMIADPRSSGFVKGFFWDWLDLKNVAKSKPDPVAFPEFDESLREAIQRETELFLTSEVRDDHSLIDLLTANYTFVNERLARHYGIPNVSGDQFRRVTFAEDTRAGLLGQASVLNATSFGNRTSPVVRGRYILELWLGVPAPKPPPNVPGMKKEDPEHPMTLRMRMEDHRKSPMCASCHTSMDPLGFALENFDAIGHWRTTDMGLPIDASVSMPDGTQIDGPTQLRSMLLEHRDALVNTIIVKMLAYSLGRPARYSDMPSVRAIAWAAASSNYKWSSTITALVESGPLQMK